MKQLLRLIYLTLLVPIHANTQSNEIPNGSFEEWSGSFPVNYGAFQAPQAAYKDLQVVFQSTDARSGKSSLRLRNGSLHEYLKKNPIPTTYMPPEIIFPAGIWSCSGDCKVPPKGKQGLERSRFTVTKRYKTLCGYYKGKLAGGDKLNISISMFKGDNAMGGSDAGLIQHAFITQSSTTWKRFEIPITYFTTDEDIIPDGALLQISIVGASFPKNPMAYAGTFGTEILIDDVAFCVGKADVLVFSPKVLNETSIPNAGQDSVLTNTEQNESNGTNVIVPQNEHLNPGVQTFVNLDNDDNDKFFDFDPTNESTTDKEVRGGDDELVKIILRIPERTVLEAKLARRNMTAKLEATKGPDNIRIWETDTKEKRIPVPKIFGVDTAFTERSGEYLIKEIWIEGIKPHYQERGTILKFTHSEDINFKDEFAITIIGIEKIEWIGKENSRNDQNALDIDPNHRNPTDRRGLFSEECGGSAGTKTLKPEGLRVFPDCRMVNAQVEALPRDKVEVKVTLSVKPVRPVKLYFESFDVDDPSAAGVGRPELNDMQNESWIDNEDNISDNRGTTGRGGEGQAGKFPGENASGILEVEFAEKEKKFPFQVTMQPGDNFRIVGSPDQDFLKNLKNDDEALNKGSDNDKNENKQRIVNHWVLQASPENIKEAEIREPDKYASKTLTVWRFVHAEVDYMDKVGDDVITGVVNNTSYNPIGGRTTIYLRENIKSSLARITNVSEYQGRNGIKDCFKQGTITIDGVGYIIVANSAEETEPDYVVVQGTVPDSVVRKPYTLRDDDEMFGFSKGDKLKDVIQRRTAVEDGNGYCGVANRFEYAYVIPDFKTLNKPVANRNPTFPFIRNLKSYDLDNNVLIENYTNFDNRATEASENFWTIYILFAYKGATYEDGDPNMSAEPVLSGIADNRNIGIHVFLEGIIERNNQMYSGANQFGLGELDCIAHEMAHLFGVKGHTQQGLMGEPPGSVWFSPRTLATIRDAKNP